MSTLCITGAGGSQDASGSRFKPGVQYKKRDRSLRSSSGEHGTDTDAHTDVDYEPEEEIVPEVNLRPRRKQTASKHLAKKAAGRVKTLKDIPNSEFRDMRDRKSVV